MRIRRDIPLATYIRGLIKEDKIYKFYKSDDWLELKAKVLRDYHNECAHCLKQGRYTRAEVVHHVNHVRVKPHLALSRYYIDDKGIKRENLIPLCDACHNKEHPEKFGAGKSKDKFMNEEKW